MAGEVTLTFDDKGFFARLAALRNASKWKAVLKRLVQTIGLKDVIQHFKDKRGPKSGWKQRDDKTNLRYEQIRLAGKRLTESKAIKKFGSIKKAKEAGKRVYVDRVGGLPRGMYHASNELLRLSGNLRQQFLPSNVRAIKMGAELFNPVKYAHRHDAGTEGMPKREFMWLSNDAKKLIAGSFWKMVKAA